MLIENNSKAETVLEEIGSLGETDELPIIGPGRGVLLQQTVRNGDIRKVLEVGALVGYSAILIAGNLPAGGRLTSIEVNASSADIARKNLRRAGLSGKARIITGDALQVIPTLKGPFDMIFIDAAKNEYFRYLLLAEKFLKPGGVVFADNVKRFAADMQDYLDYIRNSGRYRSQYYEVGSDAVEISVLK